MSAAEQFAGKHDCYGSSRRYRGEQGLDSKQSAQRFFGGRASDQFAGLLLSALIVLFTDKLLDWDPGSPR